MDYVRFPGQIMTGQDLFSSDCCIFKDYFIFWLWWIVMALVAACRLLTVAASLAAEHGFWSWLWLRRAVAGKGLILRLMGNHVVFKSCGGILELFPNIKVFSNESAHHHPINTAWRSKHGQLAQPHPWHQRKRQACSLNRELGTFLKS